MAHLRSSSYYQDSHDEYASSSSSHRQPYHSLHHPKTEHRGRPAYTTVRPFIINSTDDHDRPVRRERDDHDEHHRRVGDYVADRLVPTMLRSSDRPVEVFMNFGDAKLSLPEDSHRVDLTSRAPSHGLNAIIYNAPGCSLTIDGRRCDRYCDHCDLVDRDHRDRDRHHHLDHHHHLDRGLDLDRDRRHHDRHPRSRSHIRIVSHSRNPSPSPLPLPNRDRHYHLDRGLDLELDRRHRDRHPRSRSHVRITSSSRNPSPSPLPLPGLFPIATAVEKASHSARGARSHGNGISHALCPGCLIKTTVYRDGYCVDCDPPTYSSSSRRADVFPLSSGTRVKYIRETDGSASDDSWARVEVDPGDDRDRKTGRAGRSMERVRVYDVLTDSRGYGGDARRRGRSRWENMKERRSMPRYSGTAGYASESDL